MLEFCVDKQVITRRDHDVIVANSSDYLEVEFNFSNDWKGLGKTAIFTNTTSSLAVLLNEDNQITPDKHLNLSVGTWVVSVYGILGTKRIITNIASMVVVDSGATSGTVPAEPTPDVYEQIMTQYTNLINMLSVDNLADTIVLRDMNGSTDLTSVRFDLAPEIATVEGELSWNPAEMTVDIKTIDGITMQVGQEFLVPVNNKTASTITDGTLVSWGSTDGNSGNLNVIPYIADGTIENERVIGIATHDIEANTSGLVTRQGKLRGLNTTGSTVSETWSSGTILYASPTAAGKLTSVKPSYPNRVTRIGMVITAHATVGTIYIQVTNYPIANQIGVIDAGSYFTGTDIETVFAELGDKLTTLYDDLPPVPLLLAKTGSNVPTLTDFKGNTKQYTFSVNDEVFGTSEITHLYKNGTDLSPHIHWVTNGTDTTNRAVKWELEYCYALPSGIFTNTSILSVETVITANSTALIHSITDLGTITGTDLVIGTYLCWRLRRIASTGTAPTNNPFGLAFGIHVNQSVLI